MECSDVPLKLRLKRNRLHQLQHLEEPSGKAFVPITANCPEIQYEAMY